MRATLVAISPLLATSPVDPMKIGNLTIDPPVIMAPMVGVSNWPFRLLCRRFGAGLAFTEMVPAAAIVRGKMGPDVLSALKTHPDDRPLGFQLFGSDPQEMAEAAHTLSAFDADIIDINMGCPSRKVVNGGSGCALMHDLERARQMVRSVRAVVKVPLTVKMRLGWDNESINAAELARICEAEGADAVTVHGRTRVQAFAGETDLGRIREVVEAVAIPVIGNGGIMSSAGAKKMIEATGCAGIMVARGAKGNPWIFTEIEKGPDSPRTNPTNLEKSEVILQHLEWMLDFLPERKAIPVMKTHLSSYSKGISEAADMRRKLSVLATAQEVRELVEKYFPESSQELEAGDESE